MSYGMDFVGGGTGIAPISIVPSGGGAGFVGGGAGVATPYLQQNAAVVPFSGVTVGGSWSPEPPQNLPIFYGFNTGIPSVPQAPVGFGAQLPANLGPQALAGQGAAAPAAGGEPAAGAEPAAKKTVTVKSGDNLTRIAKAAGVDWRALYEANKELIGSNPNVIRPGQELTIP